MKKELWILIILTVIVVVLLGALFFIPAKKPVNNTPVSADGIQIISPILNQEVSSPVKIKGVVNGNGWGGFEGQVGTVKLLDSNGKELASTYLSATTEWTSLPTSFETELPFNSTVAQSAILVFHNENPSGMPEKDKTFILPIKIAKSEFTEVSVYFGNLSISATDEQDECKRVYAVKKYVEKTQAVAKAAIQQLLLGPSEKEKNQGYYTSIPVGSKLNSIRIENNIVYVDFNATTESGGGSCSMSARVAQITKTLLQFPTIKSVQLSVDGRKGDVIFQP